MTINDYTRDMTISFQALTDPMTEWSAARSVACERIAEKLLDLLRGVSNA